MNDEGDNDGSENDGWWVDKLSVWREREGPINNFWKQTKYMSK